MKKYHIVKHGVFDVFAVYRDGDVPECYHYSSWEFAYRRFRYFSSYLHWDFVRLVYRDDFGYREIVRYSQSFCFYSFSWYSAPAVFRSYDLDDDLPHELRVDLDDDLPHELRVDLDDDLPHELRVDLDDDLPHELRVDLDDDLPHELRVDLVPCVLVACESSQEVCFAFRSHGIVAFSCDISPSYGGFPDWHILSDVRDVMFGNCSFVTESGLSYHIYGHWTLIIAHPPCTFLTSASAVRLFNSDHSIKDFDRYNKGLLARNFFLSFFHARSKFLCVENPAPLKIFNLPAYSQIIHPYMFGHPYKKRTCLWLRGLPLLRPSSIVEPRGCWVVSGGGSSCRVKLTELPSVSSSKLRSKTFSGVAQAMADQWVPLLLGDYNG